MSDNCKVAIQNGQTVVFIGDSLTDCGRREEAAPLGAGYVSMVVTLMTVRYPQRKIRFINEGIGGDTTVGLRDRWDDDVIAHKPDWLSVLVGINDLHRMLRNDPEPVPPDIYRQAYKQCLQSTAENTSARLILMDPFYISRATDPNSWRTAVLKVLPEYIDIVTELAEKFDAIHVRLHEMFQRVLACNLDNFICPDPVHPPPTGHLMISHEWLKAVGW
ncbi:MAG: SGNH/GDSL hydrolase family protein [Planctomycetota bacterium]|nr:SGNH/GDSL hydrolase family protein [Planctomycetota bacterium]